MIIYQREGQQERKNMNTHNKIFLGCLGFMLVFIIGFLYSILTTENDAGVRIGVVLPLTGSQAVYGQGIQEGLTLAVEEINAKTSKKIELLYEDNHGDVKSSVAAAKKLIEIDKATLLIVGLSQHAVAVAPLAQEQRVVLYTMAAQASALNTAGDYIFKNDADSSALGDDIAKFMNLQEDDKIGIISAGYSDATKDLTIAFQKEAESFGSQVYVESFNKDETDFRTILTKLNNKGANILLINGLASDNGRILEQIGELNLNQQLFGNSAIEDNQVLATAQKHAEGVIFFTFNGIPSPLFTEKIQQRYNHTPIRWSMEAYDGLMIINQGISSIPSNKKVTSTSLKEALAQIREYEGIAGKVAFDQEGNAQRIAFIKTINNSSFRLYEEQLSS